MKSEIKHRMTRRLNGWDYCQRAIYSITVTLADRSRPWLGHLVLTENGEPRNGVENGGPRNGVENGELRNGVENDELRNGAEQGASVAAQECAASVSPTPFGDAVVAA